MEIKVLSKDTTSNIMALVTEVNKTTNLTACVQRELSKDGYYVIKIETL